MRWRVLFGCALAALMGLSLAVAGWWFIDSIGVVELPLFPFGERWTVAHALETANENRFAVPPDRALREDRLLRFLRVRQAMFAVYERHRPAILSSANKIWPEKRTPEEDAADFWRWQVTKAAARQLAEERMSVAEYYFIGVTLLDLCSADDPETSRRARARLRGQFKVAGLPSPSPLPELPVPASWQPAVREANLALALRHRNEIAEYDQIEEAWTLGLSSQHESPRAPCWSRVAPRG